MVFLHNPSFHLGAYHNVDSLANDIAAKVRGQDESGEFVIQAQINGKTVQIRFSTLLAPTIGVHAYFDDTSADDANTVFTALREKGLRLITAHRRAHPFGLLEYIPRQTSINGIQLGSGKGRENSKYRKGPVRRPKKWTPIKK